MDYRKAYEELSKALWKYDKAHADSYVELMRKYREIENELDKTHSPMLFMTTEDRSPK